MRRLTKVSKVLPNFGGRTKRNVHGLEQGVFYWIAAENIHTRPVMLQLKIERSICGGVDLQRENTRRRREKRLSDWTKLGNKKKLEIQGQSTRGF